MFSFLHEIVPDIQLPWCLSVEFLIFFWVIDLEDLVFWVVSFADFKFRSVNLFWDSFFVLRKGFQFLGTALFFLLHIIMEFIYEAFGVWLVDSEGYESLDVSLQFLLRFSLFGMVDLLTNMFAYKLWEFWDEAVFGFCFNMNLSVGELIHLLERCHVFLLSVESACLC